MKNRAIISQAYYAISIELDSPLCVSSGTSENADLDVIRNGDGELFIPGTSIAGAFRTALHLKGNENGLMGFSTDKTGSISNLIVSDLYFDENAVIAYRDGIKLEKRGKVESGGKFDMEVIDTGAVGTLYFHCIRREGDEDPKNLVDEIISKLASGEIRFGSKKNRGFGKVKVKEAYRRVFLRENGIGPLLEFKKDEKCLDKYEQYTEWKLNTESDYEKIVVPLRLTGGISIRKYSAEPEKADYSHITSGGKPVIPGSSWNGAIRSDVKRILGELGYRDVEQRLNSWFGYVNGNDAHQSSVIIEESVIDGAVPLKIVRNKVDRFSGATIDGALYTEIAYFGGCTELCMWIRKDIGPEEYDLMKQILDIVIWDIKEGYLPIGGLVSIGRGVFSSIENKEEA